MSTRSQVGKVAYYVYRPKINYVPIFLILLLSIIMSACSKAPPATPANELSSPTLVPRLITVPEAVPSPTAQLAPATTQASAGFNIGGWS